MASITERSKVKDASHWGEVRIDLLYGIQISILYHTHLSFLLNIMGKKLSLLKIHFVLILAAKNLMANSLNPIAQVNFISSQCGFCWHISKKQGGPTNFSTQFWSHHLIRRLQEHTSIRTSLKISMSAAMAIFAKKPTGSTITSRYY